MSIEKDPIFQGVAISVILAFLGAISVKIKREYRRIVNSIKRIWKMARGNGISLKEHNAAIDDLKKYIDQKTYSIQKDSNGGDSLPDVFVKLDDMTNRFIHKFDRIEDKVDGIAKTANSTEATLKLHIETKNAH